MKAFFRRLIFGDVKIKVGVLNSQTFFKKMQSKKVVFKQIIKTNDGFEFCVSFIDYKKIKNYCKKTNMQFQVLAEFGLKSFCFGLLKRSGIFVAISIWLIFALSFSNNVFDVYVKSESKNFGDKQSQILLQVDELVTNEINNGNKNLRNLERTVISNFNEISTCSITKNGIYYYVSITPVVTEQLIKEITSDYYCKIKEITLASGQSLVKVNDIVKPGQVLVKSIETNSGKVEPAKAYIKADAWIISSVYFDENGFETIRTGKTFSSKVINFFAINVGKFKASPFAVFEDEISVTCASTNNFLPINIVTKTYYELKVVSKKLEFEQEKDKLYKKAKELAVSQLPEGVLNYETKFVVTQEDTKYKIDCYLKFLYEI